MLAALAVLTPPGTSASQLGLVLKVVERGSHQFAHAHESDARGGSSHVEVRVLPHLGEVSQGRGSDEASANARGVRPAAPLSNPHPTTTSACAKRSCASVVALGAGSVLPRF